MKLDVTFTQEETEMSVGFEQTQVISNGIPPERVEEMVSEAKEEGFDEGKAVGIQSEYDRFWDAFQENGNRLQYRYAFAYDWNNEIFRPKYDLTPVDNGGNQMFQYSSITDLIGCLAYRGVKLVTSNMTSAVQMFQGTLIERVPEIDMRLMTNTAYMFGTGAKVKTIDKLIVSDTTNMQESTFNTASYLQNITFEGTIGMSINFQWSPLTTDSMKSVITHLKNYSGTDKTGTYKVTFTDACWAALEADSAAPDGNTWRDYVETTLGWLT